MTDAPIDLHVSRLDARAGLPEYKSPGAAGMDLAACLPRAHVRGESVTIDPGRMLTVPTGIALAIPDGFEGQVRPRSGLAARHGVTITNAPGTIDADYRGEILVSLVNLGPEPYCIRHGERIAQLVIAPVVRAHVSEVQELDPTARGSGGFGSTGTV